MKQCKSQEKTIIQGDFKAKMGEGRSENIVGPHRLGTQSECGEHLVEWLKQHDIVIGNTWFKVPARRKWTWRSPDSNTTNQADYILIRERFQNALKSCKAYPGADCGSDCNPVIAKSPAETKKSEEEEETKQEARHTTTQTEWRDQNEMWCGSEQPIASISRSGRSGWAMEGNERKHNNSSREDDACSGKKSKAEMGDRGCSGKDGWCKKEQG